MPVVVRVVPEAEFSQWLAQNSAGEPAAPQAAADGNDEPVAPQATDSGAEARWTLEQAMAEGESLYVSNCSACHQVNGRGLAAAGFPPLAGSAVATGPAPEHIRIALHGRTGTAMTAFGPQLTDEQLAAIVTYQRNAWGNGTGDLIDPADVAAER
jgi:cytochrome c oxidase subunit 2